MKLFVRSSKLLNMIDKYVDKVTLKYPSVIFEEYIVIPSLNNFIMLRFSNKDIEQIDISELSKRENEIRKIVFPNFLANFIGKDYKKFGLKLNNLKPTLINCDLGLEEDSFTVFPNYSIDIQEDLRIIKAIVDIEIDIWELQIHKDNIEVLHFSKNNINYSSTELNFYMIEYDASYIGIIKAEIEAIKNEVSLLDVLLKYQNIS